MKTSEGPNAIPSFSNVADCRDEEPEVPKELVVVMVKDRASSFSASS